MKEINHQKMIHNLCLFVTCQKYCQERFITISGFYFHSMFKCREKNYRLVTKIFIKTIPCSVPFSCWNGLKIIVLGCKI